MATGSAELHFDLGFTDDDTDDWFDALVAINQRWLGSYARVDPSFGVNASLLDRNSLWMNGYFQKQRMITSPSSKQARTLLAEHRQIITTRVRTGNHSVAQDAKHSTSLVEPMVAMMFAASGDRCPQHHLEPFLVEALDLLQCKSLRVRALRSGFSGCVFRFLTTNTEAEKRIVALQILVILAKDDPTAVVGALRVAAQGQLWQPHMFIYMLQKRHFGNDAICDLVRELLMYTQVEMPIESPVRLSTQRLDLDTIEHSEPDDWSLHRQCALPAIRSVAESPRSLSPHRPVTTVSSLYVGVPSPYSTAVILPIARPPTNPVEQQRRAKIYSTPKEKAISGERRRRCLTPNIPMENRAVDHSSSTETWITSSDSPTGSPSSPTKKTTVPISERYSWSPECINSVSGFEWWWRSLPSHHASLEPTQKLKMVTKTAVRLHSNGEWQRATELYLLALSMDVTREIEFRLRVNLGCAYEVGENLNASVFEFRAALKINPHDPYTCFKLGSALKELGQLDEAKEMFESVVEIYPQATEALKLVKAVRESRRKSEEQEKVAIALARKARSPKKPGPKFNHSHGMTVSTTLPVLSATISNETSPRLGSDRRRPSRDSAIRQRVHRQHDLVSCIASRVYHNGIELRRSLNMIDTTRTGLIRIAALSKLMRGICNVCSEQLNQYQAHDLLKADRAGFICYETLIAAVEGAFEQQLCTRMEKLAEWINLVETIKLEEHEFYATISANAGSCGYQQPITLPTDHKREDSCEVDANEEIRSLRAIPSISKSSHRQHRHNLKSEFNGIINGEERVQDNNLSTNSASVGSLYLPTTALGDTSHSKGDVDGYRSVSARLHERREKARHEAIMRVERSRVVARKHLYSLNALQEVATRAREHVTIQMRARDDLRTLALTVKATYACAEETTPKVVDDGTKQLRACFGHEALGSPQTTIAEQLVSDIEKVAIRNGTIAEGMAQLRTLAIKYSTNYCRVSDELLALSFSH